MRITEANRYTSRSLALGGYRHYDRFKCSDSRRWFLEMKCRQNGKSITKNAKLMGREPSNGLSITPDPALGGLRVPDTIRMDQVGSFVQC